MRRYMCVYATTPSCLLYVQCTHSLHQNSTRCAAPPSPWSSPAGTHARSAPPPHPSALLSSSPLTRSPPHHRTTHDPQITTSICHHHAYPRAALVAQSLVKEATYREVLRRAEQALDLRAAFTPQQLAVVLGGEQAAGLAERILRAYEVGGWRGWVGSVFVFICCVDAHGSLFSCSFAADGTQRR